MSRIVGLGDLKKKEEDDKKTNEYYTGGVDARGGGSGMAVQGRPDDDIFSRLMQQAQQRPQAPVANAMKCVITMYRNGFVVDNGPLRDMNAPENQEFLEDLNRGVVPRELERQAKSSGNAVNVELMNKQEEDYVPPAYVAFSGGSVVGATSISADAEIFSREGLASIAASVDDSKPSTVVQVKSAHGPQKIRVKVNLDSTVAQLAKLCVDLSQGRPFTLSAGFPPVTLTNPNQTVKEAGLTGASIVLTNV